MSCRAFYCRHSQRPGNASSRAMTRHHVALGDLFGYKPYVPNLQTIIMSLGKVAEPARAIWESVTPSPPFLTWNFLSASPLASLGYDKISLRFYLFAQFPL
jgi:hypothetical protein